MKTISLSNSLRRVHDHQRPLVKTLECSRTPNCADIRKSPPQGWSWANWSESEHCTFNFVNSLPMDQNPKLRQHQIWRTGEISLLSSLFSLLSSLYSFFPLFYSLLSFSLSSWSFLHFSLAPLSKFFYTEIHKFVLFHCIIFHTYLTCSIQLRRFLLKKNNHQRDTEWHDRSLK